MSEQVPELGPHHCSACGQQHGGERPMVPEVEIARIHAERDIAIARMEYREATEAAVLEAETAVVLTELETESAVVIAEETDMPGDQVPEPGPPVMVAPPNDEPAEPAPADMAPPEVVETSSPSSSSGNDGWWSGYQ